VLTPVVVRTTSPRPGRFGATAYAVDPGVTEPAVLWIAELHGRIVRLLTTDIELELHAELAATHATASRATVLALVDDHGVVHAFTL